MLSGIIISIKHISYCEKLIYIIYLVVIFFDSSQLSSESELEHSYPTRASMFSGYFQEVHFFKYFYISSGYVYVNDHSLIYTAITP